MKKLFTVSFALLVSCSAPSNNTNKIKEVPSDNPSVLDYKDVTTSIKWIDIFEQLEERYLVYFYSESCGHCKSVKEEFISYYLLNKEKIYFLDTVKENAIFKNDAPNLIGKDNLEDFYVPGTPFLAEFTSWTITNYYFGESAVRNYIKSNTQ